MILDPSPSTHPRDRLDLSTYPPNRLAGRGGLVTSFWGPIYPDSVTNRNSFYRAHRDPSALANTITCLLGHVHIRTAPARASTARV